MARSINQLPITYRAGPASSISNLNTKDFAHFVKTAYHFEHFNYTTLYSSVLKGCPVVTVNKYTKKCVGSTERDVKVRIGLCSIWQSQVNKRITEGQT